MQKIKSLKEKKYWRSKNKKKEKKKARDALSQLNASSASSTVLEQSPSMSLEESQSPSRCSSLKETKDFSSSLPRLPLLSRATG